MASHLIE